MKLNGMFFLLTAALLLNSAVLIADVPPVENNSVTLASDLSSKILSNPSGEFVPDYTDKLMEIASAIGRAKIAGVLNQAAKKLESNGNTGNLSYKILKLSIDELEFNRTESLKNFSIIRRWNISGPWKKYGIPDFDYQFSPEKVFKIEDIEKGRNIIAPESGVFFPYKLIHEKDETLYAVNSFASETGIILWIQSDSEYKLIINGREIRQRKSNGKKTTEAFALNGARGYTVLVKMQSGTENHQPFIRGMITDEKFKPVQLKNSDVVFNYSFTSKIILNSDKLDGSVHREASILTGRLRELVNSGNYIEGYKTGSVITEKYPFYSAAYGEFIPLLDIMNRDNEFLIKIEKFRKLFPDSDLHYRWLADFYRSRDKDKFMELMKTIPINYFSEESVEWYLHLLCGEKKFSEALKLCDLLKEMPSYRHIIPEVLKAAGEKDLWRSSLLEGAALRNEAYFYYALGLSELQNGLDPVMYWEKGHSLDEDAGLMRDLTGLFENGILGTNDFYKGEYTDLHPEFRWKAKKRKISIHIFESGRIIIDGEDLIPSGNKLLDEKYSKGGSEFSSGEMKSSIPYFKDLKILYVLTAKDGLTSSVDFKSDLSEKDTITVRFKCSGEEEFSVVKYSGEYRKDKKDVFSLLKNLVLKSKDENVSELDYEVFCHGSLIPLVRYNGESLSSGRYSGGIIRFWNNEKLSDSDNDSIVAEISRFSSGDVFAGWYSNVISYSGKVSSEKISGLPEKENLTQFVRGLHFYIMSSISKTGEVDFSPRRSETVLLHGYGTVEERTLLAKAILEAKGIKSYVSFRKSKEGLIDKMLLFVPENRGSGYWVDFYGESISDKMESGYDAIVITGEGYETFPVNPETYIR